MTLPPMANLERCILPQTTSGCPDIKDDHTREVNIKSQRDSSFELRLNFRTARPHLWTKWKDSGGVDIISGRLNANGAPSMRLHSLLNLCPGNKTLHRHICCNIARNENAGLALLVAIHCNTAARVAAIRGCCGYLVRPGLRSSTTLNRAGAPVSPLADTVCHCNTRLGIAGLCLLSTIDNVARCTASTIGSCNLDGVLPGSLTGIACCTACGPASPSA